MYGMINLAVEQMITENYGDTVWQQVKTKAEVKETHFVSMKPYDDKLTYGLIGAASDVLQTPVPELLEKFGEYWILYTAQKGYGELLNLGGNNLPDFLANLNLLHVRVGHMMPGLVPPAFEVTNAADRSLTLIYRSKRQGLSPMIIGLIKGLGKRFETPCEVQLLSGSDENGFAYHITW